MSLFSRSTSSSSYDPGLTPAEKEAAQNIKNRASSKADDAYKNSASVSSNVSRISSGISANVSSYTSNFGDPHKSSSAMDRVLLKTGYLNSSNATYSNGSLVVKSSIGPDNSHYEYYHYESKAPKPESQNNEIRPNYYADANGSHDLIWHEKQMFSKYALTSGWVMNCFKYLYRFRYKNGVEDLKKARTYLDRLIEMYTPKKESENN